MLDVALVLERLVPAACYGGSLTANDQESFDALVWSDDRQKPTWAALLSAGSDVARDDLTAQVGAARFAAEMRGVTVGGVRVKTDRDSQAMIANAYSYTRASGQTVQFKGVDGFVALTPEQVEAVALAVGAHVQACFAKEAEVLAAITAGDIDSAAEVEAAFAALGDA